MQTLQCTSTLESKTTEPTWLETPNNAVNLDFPDDAMNPVVPDYG